MTVPTSLSNLSGVFDGIETVPGADGRPACLGYRRARSGGLRDAYPAGTHDIELGYVGTPSSAATADYTATLLRTDPRCRRVVLPVPELDLDAISWAEASGFRYVIDVETVEGGYSLLVTEPQWVLDQPVVLEQIPLKE